MSVRGATALAVAVLTVAGLSLVGLAACHDGAGKHTETTQIRITGTPKAGHVAPARHEPEKPADAATPAPAAGSKGRSEVGAGSTASQES